jgi:hypothetical protein
MDSPMQKFNDLINYSNNCKGNIKLYMFLKDCAFRSVFNVFQNGNLNQQDKQNIQNLYSQFQSEVGQFNWNFKLMTLNEYQAFLNDFYSKFDFNNVDLNILLLAKELTENLSFFGNYDDLAQRRLSFFTSKINEQMNKNKNINCNLGGGNTNTNIGNFYDPKKNNNYIPKLVNPTFNLPMRRSDPNYPNLKSTIEDLIENATQELDYHKVNMARENLEAVAYYISHIIY